MDESTLVVVTADGMGSSGPDLGRKLFSTWLTLVLENGTLPGAIAFYSEGVRLLCEGSPVVELLQQLEAQEVRLIACKTCLDQFGLTDQLVVGLIGGMGDIIAAQAKAAKVVNL
ncbi:MAG: DsrE family protein [Planctomycetota bacterium]|nr:DsrE family protein [Planctomycetota bacterium]